MSSPSIGASGVLLIADPPSLEDVEKGVVGGRGGFMLTRLLNWAGFTRDQFTIVPATWCAPEHGVLGGSSLTALETCKTRNWDVLLQSHRVVVPMGQIPLMSIAPHSRNILATRGYIRPGPYSSHVIPTVSPDFIVRGQSKYASAFINDVRKAVELARVGLPPLLLDYTLDPLPHVALEWAQGYRRALARNPATLLSYDIETPYADSDESERGEDDSWNIIRIGFAYKPGHALSLPWSPLHMAAIRLLLDAPGVAVDWNGAAFDRPRVRAAGVRLDRPLRDGMIAWHVLHSDMPKSLGFVATFTSPYQPEWKHLGSSRPAFYNATDADVALQAYLTTEREMKLIPGLWEAYERDVIRLEPVLRSMEAGGMPINPETRLDRAQRLTELLSVEDKALDEMVPEELHRYSPENGYVRDPDDTTGLSRIVVEAEVKRCSVCNVMNPLKSHFRRFKKPTEKRPQNPCADGCVQVALEPTERYAFREQWKPSSRNLLLYQEFHNRIIPQKYDKREQRRKPSMDKKGIKTCLRKYPEDPLYSRVLKQRELQKLAGTYIGYVEEEPCAS